MIYNLICPRCGHEWTSDSAEKSCPICRYWSIVISYEEDGEPINAQEYATIQNNIWQDLQYDLECEECGNHAKMYFGKWVWCHCGGRLVAPADITEKGPDIHEQLKTYRDEKRCSQQQMAAKLGISQTYYSMIETGKRGIPNTPKLANRLKLLHLDTIHPAP